MTVRWHSGDPKLCRLVEDGLASEAAGATSKAGATSNTGAVELLAQSRHRRGLKITGAGGAHEQSALFAKHFLSPAGRRPGEGIIALLKAAAGQSAADREWRALRALHRAQLPVPEPLARASLAGRETLLVAGFIEGRPLLEALRCEAAPRRRLLEALGGLVARLHAHGWTHGDLHAGNILVAEGHPILVDWQRARRTRSESRRLTDLGTLEFSLAQAGLSRADRMRVRIAALALDLDGARSPEAKRRLRRAGRTAEARARRHYRRRTKGCLRAGDRFARVKCSTGEGLRLSDWPEAAVDEALAAHRANVAAGGPALLKCDHRARVSAVQAGGRSAVVKEVVKGGPRKWIADLFRGSPARRAWVGGHGLRARGIEAALPLAFVERRILGLPVASAALFEDLRPSRPLSELEPEGEDTPDAGVLADALVDLTAALHRHDAVHGDLQALHVYWTAGRVDGRAGGKTALIDLEGVRFPHRLSEEQRIEALAQLNASLPDGLIPIAERLRAFERYASRLPFSMEDGAALREIARISLARGHRWRGEGCEGAAREATGLATSSRP